jgi:four helix bundle protein
MGGVMGEVKAEIKAEGRRDLPERAFLFAVRVVKVCQFLDEKAGVGRTLSKQLIRSGTSVGANIEEGQGSQSEADFLTKYSIACKEARETHYWLRLLSASQLVPEDRLQELMNECNEMIAILTTICKKIKDKREKVKG